MAHDPRAADRSLILMGEQATVVNEWVATTRVRVRRRIVTEIQTLEVEVRREELIVTPEPLATDDRYTIDVGYAPELPAPLLFVLHAEVPTVSLRVQPIEQVTLTVHTVDTEHELTVALRADKLELSYDHEPDPVP